MNDTYFLGIDAGGTKTHCLIINKDEELISEWTTGPGNYRAVGLEKAMENLFESILVAMLKAEQQSGSKKITIAASCVGLASLDTKHDAEVLEAGLKNIFNKAGVVFPTMVNDAQISLRAGTTSKNAIEIICGTGSNCYGINEDGKETWVDGLETILGDSASGYSMGVQALRYAVQSYDGRIKKTALEQKIAEHFKITNIRDLKNIVYQTDFTKKDIAVLSKTVFALVAQDDWAAIEIVDSTAKNAVHIIKTAARNLNMRHFDLILSGGLFANEPYMHRVVSAIAMHYPYVKINLLEKSPVWGAVLLAKENYTNS